MSLERAQADGRDRVTDHAAGRKEVSGGDSGWWCIFIPTRPTPVGHERSQQWLSAFTGTVAFHGK